MAEAKSKSMFESLLEIQKAMKTVQKNKTAFKGKYADIENVWESIRHIVNDAGFVVVHYVTEKGVKTEAMHQSGNKLEPSFIPFAEGNTDPQERGKEITYAKRYNINAIFNVIVAEEDTDATKKLGNYEKKGVNGELAAKKLKDAKTKEEAKEVYKTLSADERKTNEVVEAIGLIKEKFALK